MEKQFTSTVYILNCKEAKVLLLFHKKLQKWLPPGGHVEMNETPPEAARREVMEETGLEIEFLEEENIWIDNWNAVSIERPYMCLLENIPAYKETPAHQHIDFIYVAIPKSSFSSPTEECKWFSWEDLSHFTAENEIFEETLQTIQHILKNSGKLLSKNITIC